MNGFFMNGPQVLSSMGDVEIMGADVASVLDSLGDPSSAMQVRNAVNQMRVMKQVDPNAMGVIEAAYKSVAVMPLGIPATAFTVGSPGPLSIEVKSSRPVKPLEMIIPSTLAPFFVISSATISGTDMLSGGSLPLECYSSAAFRSKISWPTINTSTPLNLNVTMTDLSANRTFRGIIQGPTLLK